MSELLDEFEEEESAGINLTPMVNLSLVLVMIFMVTSPFFIKELMPVALPEAVTTESESQENITISISPTEGYAVNENQVSKQQLYGAMSEAVEQSINKYLLIRADERVPHGEIEDIMKIGKKLGVNRIAFATVPKI